MRLIDADRLLRSEILPYYYHLPNGDVAIPIIDIEHAPTVELEIVKCKNCIHNHEHGDCPIDWPHNDDDYCSFAEREE